MEIRFWGVRGSIASPGAETAGVGGNTSSIEVVCGKTRLLLDAGTGLRELGNQLMAKGEPVEASLLLSHFHWDHIQGLPFFVPVYVPQTKLEIVAVPTPNLSLRDTIAKQMRAPHFPIDLADLGSALSFREVRPLEPFEIGEARVRCARLNH